MRVLLLLTAPLIAALVTYNGARAQQQTVAPCEPVTCWCMASAQSSQGGFGPGQFSGIQIRWIDPRVTSISITGAANETLFSGLPTVGQFIAVPGPIMNSRATATETGLGCAIAYWTIDSSGQPVHRHY